MSDHDDIQKHASHKESRETLEKTQFGDQRLQEVHSQLLREKEEPEEGFAPMPMFMIFLFAGLSFWAGIYLVKYSGGFSPYVYNETEAPGSQAEEVEREPEPLPIRGETVFARNCVQCHQSSGQGVAGAFPPLVGSEWVNGPEERLVRILLNGLAGELVIQGVTYNGQMPAFKDQLNDRDIAAVATYIRQAWGNSAPQVEVATVEDVRSRFGSRSQAWDVSELEALSAEEGQATAQ